ncbi:MAG: DUF1924 domain-containing protein [Nitrosomonadales bacterium]|nr:DUF1924 domain-containing protein [Nitrosomonadales bacterium]
MFRIYTVIGLVSVAAMGLATQPAFAQTPNETLASFKTAAAGDAKFQGFSATRGEQFFKAKHGKEWSCASCHTDNPAAPGKHANSGKDIQPLAPSANAERFTDMAKVEKWFKRNCNDVLGRVCTAQEKGDVLSYLLTVKK